MKAENINIKKLEQFCQILVRLGITKKIDSTTTVKQIMSVGEFKQLRQDYSEGRLKAENLPEWKAIQGKVWNDDKQEFEVSGNIVAFPDIAEHGMTEEEFYNQKVQASYKVANKAYQAKIEELNTAMGGVTSPDLIKKTIESINLLRKSIRELEQEVLAVYEEEGKMVGGGERSFLENMLKNQELYKQVVKKK